MLLDTTLSIARLSARAVL